ncbi:hypothetical protein [Streptomyces asoensis]
MGRLVERAREAGELRTDVSVSDVLLVIATESAIWSAVSRCPGGRLP